MGILMLIFIVMQHLEEKKKEKQALASRDREMRAAAAPATAPRKTQAVGLYVVNSVQTKASLDIEADDDVSFSLSLPSRKDILAPGKTQIFNRPLSLEPGAEIILVLTFQEGAQLDLLIHQDSEETRYEDVRQGTYALLLSHDYWVKWKAIRDSATGTDPLPRFTSTRRFDYNALGRGLYVIDPAQVKHLLFSTEKPPAQQNVQYALPLAVTYYIQVFRVSFQP
jgi:hypothetical protein